jgi:hypothetical protein
MTRPLICLVALSLVFLAGCNSPVQANSQPKLMTEYSRFQLVSGTAYGIALDTKTGELCHTFNPEIDQHVPAKGAHETFKSGHPSLESIPLCIDLSQDEARTVKNLRLANAVRICKSQSTESSNIAYKVKTPLPGGVVCVSR